MARTICHRTRQVIAARSFASRAVDRAQVDCDQGRVRRSGTGFVHQRPENRQRGGGSGGVAAAGRGQATSTAATIAATSSSVASPPRLISTAVWSVVAPVAVPRVMPVSPTYSGTLPCLRLGSSSRLERSIASPVTSLTRVSAGSITSSM
jgi:hypothetical protein